MGFRNGMYYIPQPRSFSLYKRIELLRQAGTKNENKTSVLLMTWQLWLLRPVGEGEV